MNALLISIAVILAIGYAIIIFWVIKNWDKNEQWKIPTDWRPSTFATILIPARNESKNITACLQSTLNQNFPSDFFEIIVIDDHSEDNTVERIKSLNSTQISVLKLSDFPKINGQHYKKAAIELGIQKAKGELIITTDADCIAAPDWLSLLVFFYESKKAKFIAAPVNFHQEKNTFERFQSLDYIGMMGVTGAGIFSKKLSLCNGANLAYDKKSFIEVDGFEGIDKIASGDDMLLLEKFQNAFPDDIYFLKNTAVTIKTEAKPTLQSFINQRLRWAAKTSHYQNRTTIFLQTWVGAFSFGIVLSIFLTPFLGILGIRLFVYSFVFKAIVDYFYLRKMTSFFNRKDLMRHFLSAQIWHLLYIVLVGVGSFFIKKVEWKGRNLRT